MGPYTLRLLVLILACSYLVASNAIPISRLTNISNKGREFVRSKIIQQDEMTTEEKMDDDFEGRMAFEKDDYGPTTSNPVHTPRPPHT